MLKVYVLAIAAIVGMAIFVASQDEQAAHDSAQKGTNLPKVVSPQKRMPIIENIEDAEGHLPSWYGFFRWPNATTTWAIIFTLIALAEQTQQTRKAAEASLEQTQHMITSERAWIIVSSRFPDGLSSSEKRADTRFRWEFKNVGKSPARLIEFNGVARRAKRNNISFPEPAPFPRPFQSLNNLLLVPTDSWGATWKIEENALSADEIDSLKYWKETTLVTYGYVKYLDVFGKEHITRFCKEFWFDKKMKKEMFLPKIEAPPSYTDCD